VSENAAPREMGFLLIEGFSLLSFAAAVEPLRAANILSGKPLYRWRNIAFTEGEISASNGLAIRPDHGLADAPRFDTVFVCAAGNPTTFHHEPTLNWLRRIAAAGANIAGVSGGPFILARAGVLAGYRCAIHWEHAPAFVEAFPELMLTRALFEIDRDRLTCGGGVAALDMMHELIARDHGPALAAAVSDWFLQTEIRMGEGAQRLSARERYGTGNAKLIRALAAMEARLDEPASRERLAGVAGVSLRQLERLFAAELGGSIERIYLKLRLDRARLLLRQSTLSVVEIGVACGFASPSHFSRSYKARFGAPPKTERTTAVREGAKAAIMARPPA
jgi:transcriptional regulator GlxA family with amidase domain